MLYIPNLHCVCFVSQAFKRELKTKEPVIMSALETVQMFLAEKPLEGLEKLYQEPRGNRM